MSSTTFRARLDKLEAKIKAQRQTLHVIADNDPAFMVQHGRLMTEAEIDEREAELRASGAVWPGEDVLRIIHVIVDPPRTTLPRRHTAEA